VAGAPAESFETTARRYAAPPYARQTLGNRLGAFIAFNLTPFYPGYDFDRWDKAMAFPPAPNPTLSIEDQRWRREHAAQNGGPSPAAAPARRAIARGLTSEPPRARRLVACVSGRRGRPPHTGPSNGTLVDKSMGA
jgi:hypothetical protein